LPVAKGSLSTGKKAAIGCGGCFGLMVLISVIGGQTGDKGHVAVAGSGTSAQQVATTNPPTSPDQYLKVGPRDLLQAYHRDESEANRMFRGKWVQIEGLVTDTTAIMDGIKKGKDVDNAFNLDVLVKEMPDADTLKKEADLYHITTDLLKSLYPCIEMELNLESHKIPGSQNTIQQGPFLDIHFAFDKNRKELATLKKGRKARIGGRVDEVIQGSVILRDCKVLK
jgi:hypothetical protein